MAATITGTFAILDRASRPINQIRNAALEADAAVKKLGFDLDKVGTQQHLRQLDSTENRIRNIGRGSADASDDADVLGKRLEKVGAPQLARDLDTTNRSILNTSAAARSARRDVDGYGRDLERLGTRARGTESWLDRLTRRVIGLRPPLMAALVPMVGLAAQGLGALTAGAVALIPKLTDLVGLAAPAGVAFVGMGLAMVTAKLAVADLSKAMSGNKKALEALTPEGRHFLNTLKLYKPVVEDLRRSAQQGLFPGLDTAIRRGARAVPVARQVLRGAGATLGGIAADAARQITTPAALRDFQLIATGGEQVMRRFGSALLNVFAALRSVLVAALPLTDWLSHTILRWTEGVRATTELGRSTGSLSAKFDRVRQSTETMWSVLHNVWSILKSIGQASRGMGDSLWGSIDRTTKGWAEFLRGPQGQQDMQRYFMRMRPVLAELTHFLGDLGRSLGRLSMGEGFTRSIRMLDEALPSLTKGLGELAAVWGPELFRALRNVIELFSTLAGGTGPVMSVFRMLNGILELVNKLVRAVPGVGTAMSAAFSLLLFNRVVMSIRGIDGGLVGLARKWAGVKTAAQEAEAAERKAASVPMRPPVAPVGVPPVGAGPVGRAGAGPVAPVRVTRAAPVAPVPAEPTVLPMVGRAGEGGMRNTLAGARLTAAAGVAAGVQRLGSLASTAASAIGRFVLPLMAIQGVLGAASAAGEGAGLSESVATGVANFTGGLTRKLGGAFNPAPIPSVGQAQEQGTAAFLAQAATGRRQVEQLGHGESLALAGPKLPGFNAATGAFTGQGVNMRIAQQELSSIRSLARGTEQLIVHPGNLGERRVAAMRGELAAMRQIEAQYQQFIRSGVVAAETHGRQLAEGFGQAYSIYERRYGPSKAFSLTTKDILGQMGVLKTHGRLAMSSAVLEWAKAQAAANPALRRPVNQLIHQMERRFNDLGQHVRIVNGLILTGSTQQWQEIEGALSSPAERAQERVSKAFTGIQREAIAALSLMGFDPKAAAAFVAAQEKGGPSLGQVAGRATHAAGKAAGDIIKGIGRATGGRLGGVGLQDTIPLGLGDVAAPGELIVNRHTERRVDTKLAQHGTSLWREVQGENTPHHMPSPMDVTYSMGGRYQGGGRSRYERAGQQGGRRSMTATGGLWAGVHQGVRTVAEAILAAFPGLAVSSTTSGGHVAGSYHYLGEAVDIAGAAALMNRAAAWVGANYGASLTEGIHNPNLSIKYGKRVPASYWGPSIWAGHADHIHIAVTGGAVTGAAGGAGLGMEGPPPQIHLRRARERGAVPALLAARAENVMAAGLERRINAALRRRGGGGGAVPANLQGQKRIVAEAAARWGIPAPFLWGVYGTETSFGSNLSTSSAGAVGPFQFLPSTARSMGVNPHDFRSAAFGAAHLLSTGRRGGELGMVRVFYGAADPGYLANVHRYERQFGLGGRRSPDWAGWNQAGGEATFHRPTVIGVGEGSRPERVRISPQENRAGGGKARGHVAINFHPGSIVVHGTDHAAADKFVDHVMHRLAGALENMGLESELDVST